jgi:hypothetical protein
MKQYVVKSIAVIFALGVAMECMGSESEVDHLVPIKEQFGSSARYDRLWRQKLLVTSGEVARFVGLPGTSGVETAVSVYRFADRKESLPGNYWVTATQASQRLWDSIDQAKVKTKAKRISIVRCDAPLTESTALSIHRLWVSMLAQSRPQTNRNEIILDSSREIFSATDDHNRVLMAQVLSAPGRNTKKLIDIALSLLEYCGVPVEQRALVARKIEKQALLLSKQLQPRG